MISRESRNPADEDASTVIVATLGMGWVVLTPLVIASSVGFATVRGGEPTSQAQAARDKFFEQSVRPLLARELLFVPWRQEAKRGPAARLAPGDPQGGESGPAVVPAKPDESLLVEAINYEGVEMPPNGKLDPAKVAILTRWVSLGAPWPSRTRAAHAPAGATVADSLDRSSPTPTARSGRSNRFANRAFPTSQRREQPTGPTGTRNPIDRFILQALLKNGLTPAPRPTSPP